MSRNRAELEPLVRSIAAHGVLQPLLVRGDGPSYIAVAGRNRLEAARLAGLTTVPCVILSSVDGSQADALARSRQPAVRRPRGSRLRDSREASVDAFRQSLRRHMTTHPDGDDALDRRRRRHDGGSASIWRRPTPAVPRGWWMRSS